MILFAAYRSSWALMELDDLISGKTPRLVMVWMK